MPRTTERKVADTVLQRPKKIKIGGKDYRLARMTFATVVEMSAAISEIPETIAESKENLVASTLHSAKDYGSTPRVIAVAMCGTWLLMLGRFGHWLFRLLVRRKAVRLGAKHSPMELNLAAQQLIQHAELGDFFALTTFLAGINMIKATKVEDEEQMQETETTASGL